MVTSAFHEPLDDSLKTDASPTKEICTVCPSMALIQGQWFTQTSSGRRVLTQHTRTGTDKTRRMLVGGGCG
jgi:hypothetical protein